MTTMIITMVTFPAPGTPIDNPRALLESTAPAYRCVPGLQRKYFVGHAKRAGGIYQWQDRASAERFHDEEWRQRLRDRYGVEPDLEYFECPCLVDNLAGETQFAAGDKQG